MVDSTAAALSTLVVIVRIAAVSTSQAIVILQFDYRVSKYTLSAVDRVATGYQSFDSLHQHFSPFYASTGGSLSFQD